MFKTLFIAALVSLLAACSTTFGSSRAGTPETATMGAPGATFHDTIGPRGNGP